MARLNAENKIEKELDIIRFIKQTKYLKVILSLLFTRQERYLISKNKRLTVSHVSIDQTSDMTDELDPATIDVTSNLQMKLLE